MNLSLAKSFAMSGPEAQAFADGARHLARRLSEFSQKSVAARWLNDLEFMVWQDLMDRCVVEDENLLVSSEGNVLPRLEQSEKEEFRQLSEAISGWIVYDPQDAQDRAAFVPLSDWIPRFEAWIDRAKVAALQIADAQSSRS